MPFRSALSGINAAAQELRIIGNNVSNASTTGFKQSRANFADVYAASSSGGTANSIGAGVRLASVDQLFTQGNVGLLTVNWIWRLTVKVSLFLKIMVHEFILVPVSSKQIEMVLLLTATIKK